MNFLIHHSFLAVALGACVVATATDLRTGNIPNWLTLGVFFASPVAHAALAFYRHHSLAHAAWSLALSLASGVAAALVPLALARSGGLGLGDVKLFAAIGAACGVMVALYAQTYAYVFAMVYALVLMSFRGRLAATLANVRGLLEPARRNRTADSERHVQLTELKFGPAILAGMCVAAWAKWGA